MFDLAGKVALVTGASTGLGRHFAVLLARQGAIVAAASRRTELLADLATEIGAAGGRVLPVALDVTDKDSVAAAVATVEAELGAIHILVNNAGLAIAKPSVDVTEADWDTVLDTNLKGAFLMATEVARHMKRRGHGGSIINIASVLGLRQAAQVAAYATSKAALVQLTKVLALEWARHGIRVNAIAPGYIETAINREFWETEAGRTMLKRIPQQRLGQAEDLDGPILLLASDASAYMTGSVVVVDGGHLTSTL